VRALWSHVLCGLTGLYGATKDVCSAGGCIQQVHVLPISTKHSRDMSWCWADGHLTKLW